MASETPNQDDVASGSPELPGSAEKVFRVLVVDDDEAPREVITRLLESMGCEVTPTASAQEALSAFVSGTFDLVTLDYRMPGMDGMAFHRILSQEFGAGKRTTGSVPKKLPPIVVVTGYSEEPNVVYGQFGESVVGVIQKPNIEEQLARIVQDLLGATPGPDSSAPEGR